MLAAFLPGALYRQHREIGGEPGKYADGNVYFVVEASSNPATAKTSCVKRWVLRTMILGRRCELGLGSLRLISLSEAREEAASLRKLARKRVSVLC